MTDQHTLESYTSSASLLQAPWLSQSSLVGRPAEQAERYEDVLALSTRIIELAPENILAHLLQGRMLRAYSEPPLEAASMETPKPSFRIGSKTADFSDRFLLSLRANLLHTQQHCRPVSWKRLRC